MLARQHLIRAQDVFSRTSNAGSIRISNASRQESECRPAFAKFALSLLGLLRKSQTSFTHCVQQTLSIPNHRTLNWLLVDKVQPHIPPRMHQSLQTVLSGINIQLQIRIPGSISATMRLFLTKTFTVCQSARVGY